MRHGRRGSDWTARLRKISAVEADFDRTQRFKERLDRLRREAAEVEVELSRAEGAIKGVPHYWAIER